MKKLLENWNKTLDLSKKDHFTKTRFMNSLEPILQGIVDQFYDRVDPRDHHLVRVRNNEVQEIDNEQMSYWEDSYKNMLTILFPNYYVGFLLEQHKKKTNA